MEGHCTSINQVLEFLGYETVISSNDTEKISPPPFLVLLFVGNKNHGSKCTAFASPTLVDRIWNLVEGSAPSFGYAKLPTTANSRSPADISLLDMEKGLPKGRHLTHAPSGGELSDQLLEFEMAVATEGSFFHLS
jgi:hypothetical protein